MTIQQVTSSGNNGIMSFLFQDDGSLEGTVPESAEFAKTLRQLLGDDDATADAALSGTEQVTDETPLSAELDMLADDFTLPAHGAELPDDTRFDGDDEAAQAAWAGTAFADMLALKQAHAADAANAANAPEGEVRHATSGLQQLDELTRNAEQAAQSLQPGVLQPPPATAAGKSAPTSGKFLPQGFRQTANALSHAMAAATRNPRAANIGADMQAIGTGESAFSNAFSSNAIAELVGGDARTAQGNTPANAPLVHALQAPRIDTALPAAAKPLADPALTPHFDAPHIVGTDAWIEDIGARVEWLTEMNIDKAELQLHPAELGLLEIQITSGEEGTHVSFVTHNADARTLIEDSMPKLRELLAHHGLQLGDSQVSQHSERQRDTQEMHAARATQPDVRTEDETPARRTVYVRDPNRIDHYV